MTPKEKKLVVMEDGVVLVVDTLDGINFKGAPNFLVVDGKHYLNVVEEKNKKMKELEILLENKEKTLKEQAKEIFKEIEKCKDGTEYFNKIKKKYLKEVKK